MDQVEWRYCTSELGEAFSEFRNELTSSASGDLPKDFLMDLGDGSSKSDPDRVKKMDRIRAGYASVSRYSMLWGRCSDAHSSGQLFLKIEDTDWRFKYMYVYAKRIDGQWRVLNATKEPASVRADFELVK